MGSPLPTGGGVWIGRIFVEFLSKNAGFYAFYCEKLFVVRNLDRGGVMDPQAAENVKRTVG